MKRVSFDLASGTRFPKYDFRNTPADARLLVPDEQIVFQAGTAWLDDPEKGIDFFDACAFAAFLANADEIISFNGRVYDLILLERLIDPDVALRI